jgi:hypothetical protein
MAFYHTTHISWSMQTLHGLSRTTIHPSLSHLKFHSDSLRLRVNALRLCTDSMQTLCGLHVDFVWFSGSVTCHLQYLQVCAKSVWSLHRIHAVCMESIWNIWGRVKTLVQDIKHDYVRWPNMAKVRYLQCLKGSIGYLQRKIKERNMYRPWGFP